MTKKNGWNGESQRHALASRGARTVQYSDNILKYKNQHISSPGIKYQPVALRYDSNGILMQSEGIELWADGILGDAWKSIKDGASKAYTAVKTKVQSGVQKVKDWNDDRKANKTDKEKRQSKIDREITGAHTDTLKEMAAAKQAEEVLNHKVIEPTTKTTVKAEEKTDIGGFFDRIDAESTDKKAFTSESEAKKVETYEDRLKSDMEQSNKELEKLKVEEKVLIKNSEELVKTVDEQAKEKQEAEDIATGDSIGSKLSSMVKNLGSTENRPPSGDMNDVNEVMFTSADADSIIATSENKEKLILYESKLKRTIDLFNVERKTKLSEFRNGENYLRKQIYTEKTLAQNQLNSRIKNIQTSGMPKESAKAKIDLLKNDFNTTWSNKGLVLKNLQSQHKADVNYINRISHNLDNSRHAVEKKLKQISLRK
jgi:hypothetical protein